MYATYQAAASGKLTAFGFRTNLERDYELGPVLGEGAFGVVRRCVERRTRRAYAAKILPCKRAGRALEPHYAARVLHEVDALAAVGNSLNASHLHAAYEDSRQVALILELCSGGALLSRVAPGAWGERGAQRAALDIVRALAHCHSAGVLVRDVKPDNFLYRDASPQSPLKMIDFGLAVTLPPLKMPAAAAAAAAAAPAGADGAPLAAAAGAGAGAAAAAAAAGAGAPPPPAPRTPLQQQPKVTDRAGTPHFCAPEVLRMSYGYPADVWSAGVIVYLLLAGRFPWAHDPQVEEDERAAADGRGAAAPGGAAAIAAGGALCNRDLFRAILRGELDFGRPPFGTAAVSEEARDFVRRVLTRDADARPAAAELLRHPWLVAAAELEAGGGGGAAAGAAAAAATAARPSSSSSSSSPPPPLDPSLVQRLQRFGAYGRLRQLALRRVAHLALLEFEEEEEEEGEGGAAGGNGNGSGGAGGTLARVVREFRALPRGADGRVPYAAVADALARYDLSDGERRMLALQLDADRDGRVDLDEFCAAMADWGALSGGAGEEEEEEGGGDGGGGGGGGGKNWGRWLRAVFDALDRDRSGRISGEELEDALCGVDFGDDEDGARGAGGGGGGDGAPAADGGAGGEQDPLLPTRLCDAGEVAQALREADADGDGALSLAEFEALLRGGAAGDAGLSLFPARLRRRPAVEGARAPTPPPPPPPSQD
jgi:calcium-dependent protein kinase